MATVKCYNCEAEVSSQLITCPGCGTPVGYRGDRLPVQAIGLSSGPSSARLLAPPPVSARPDFSPVRLPASIAVVTLIFAAVVSLLTIPVELAAIDGTQRLINDEPITLFEVLAYESELENLGWAALAAMAASGIAFCFWIYRAYKNLPSLGATGLEHSPRWAVASFLVPFVSLWRPYQVMGEIWRASEGARVNAYDWRDVPNHPLMGFWWGLWLIGGVVGNFVLGSVIDEPADLQALRSLYYFLLAADILLIPCAALAAILVWEISRTQERATDTGAEFKPLGFDGGPSTGVQVLLATGVLAAATVATYFATTVDSDEALATVISQRDTPLQASDNRTSSDSGARRGAVDLANAPSYLDIASELPGFKQVDPSTYGLVSLGPDFSEWFVFESEDESQVVQAYMATVYGPLEVAGAKLAFNPDTLEAVLRAELGQAAAGLTIDWTEPSVGNRALYGVASLPEAYAAVHMLLFLQEVGNDAALVYLEWVLIGLGEPDGSVVDIGRAIAKRICDDGGC